MKSNILPAAEWVLREASRRKRRLTVTLLGLGLLPSLGACAKGERFMGTSTILNVVLNSFLDRPISAIKLNKTYLGASGPYGSTSVVSGVEIPFGAQRLSWELGGPEGTPRNGETVFTKNQVTIERADIPPDTRYLGISLYPDYTIEIAFAQYIPYVSKRGEKILEEQGKNG